MASWACGRCTFLNPPTQKSSCQVCSSRALPSSPSSSSSPSPLRWSCRACTFYNLPSAAVCEMCGIRAAPGSALEDVALDEEELSDPAIGSVFLPLHPCGRKRRASLPDVVELCEKMPVESSLPGNVDSDVSKSTLKIMSYNVWFREDVDVVGRMKAIGNLVKQHAPDLLCFQEVTPNIYRIFQESDWWKEYKCSVTSEMAAGRPYFCMLLSMLPVKSFSCRPFSNSIMGRELCLADINIGKETRFVLATSHLESPCPAPPTWDQMYSKERVFQANEAIDFLKELPNAVFAGDMNWDEKKDGAFPLPEGWIDPWEELRPGQNGWTYDTKANGMLSGSRTLQKRLDRFACRLKDFEIDIIEMIGKEAIPGLTYHKEKKVRKEVKNIELPVLPSDHFGILLTLTARTDG